MTAITRLIDAALEGFGQDRRAAIHLLGTLAGAEGGLTVEEWVLEAARLGSDDAELSDQAQLRRVIERMTMFVFIASDGRGPPVCRLTHEAVRAHLRQGGHRESLALPADLGGA